MTLLKTKIRIFKNQIRILAHSVILITKYRPWGKAVQPSIVYMMDEYKMHCGFADRIKQIIGMYAFCKHHGLNFRLVANSPYELADYLKPKYAWTVPENRVSRNYFYSRPLYLGYRSKEKYTNLLLNKNKQLNKQLHVYANVYCGFTEDFGYTRGQLFHELFEPIQQITDYIKDYKKQYTEWNCMHFRMMNLLGDFNEMGSMALKEDEKNKLIKKFMDFIKDKVRNENKHFLICSDSVSFLQHAAKIPNVFILPGEPAHIDYTKEKSFDFHLKTFHDFFMIAASKKIYSISSGDMYNSKFPELAANINDVPFERLKV